MFNFPMTPPAASNFAGEHDALFYAITFLAVLFTLIVSFLVVFFALKYRRGTKADRSRPMYENLALELSWIIIPTILGLAFFGWGTKVYIDMRTPPKDAMEIFVIGKQWMWHVQHPNGVRENNTLHVPMGKPVKLTMISQDVIHAFYIPAFRVQYMVVPGRYTQMWFTPTKKGEYHLFCNMYCGTQHSEMGGRVVVLGPREYADWLANNGSKPQTLTVAQAGEKIFNKVGCNNCHGGADNQRAPSLAGIYGKTRVMTDGARYIADETYLREAILRPSNKITKGYINSMAAYEGQLTEEEVVSLLAYIKSGANPAASEPAMSSALAAKESRISEGTAGNYVGAMQFNSQRADATPTKRGAKMNAVGAMAAERVGDQ